ncbi:MAG: MipA/OmpV family protein, partial [Caldimonas sp.]
MSFPRRARRAGLAFLVLLSGAGPAVSAVADELPLPGPAIEGPVYKAGDPQAPVGATEKPLWELGLGVAGVRFPDYRGSDQANFFILPLPYIAYRGKLLRADSDGARAILFAGKRVTVDISVSASVPTRSQHNDARQGMPDLAGTFEIGPNLNVELWQSADRRMKVEFRLPLRQAVTLQSHPHNVGLTLSPNVNLDARDFIGRWKLGALIGPLFGNRRQHQYFYGVAPEFATPERAAYDAPGGYSGWRAIAALSRRYGNLYVGGFVRHDDLHDARYAPSPLVRS